LFADVGEWLQDWKLVTLPSGDLVKLTNQFEDVFTGVVLYDPNVPATSSIASTIAGV
jgi:hypothetical protein